MVRFIRRYSTRLDRRRLNVECGHAAQLAAVACVVEGPTAMHRRPVVPDHEVSDAPLVPIDELGLRPVFDEIAQKKPSFGNRPVDDP